MNQLKIGVIGSGNMGRNHIRILSEEKNYFDFAGFYDPAAEKADAIAKRFAVSKFNSISSLLDAVDAVVIAAPSSLHKQIALQAAQKHVHALVEKPLAINSRDGLEITQAFKEAGLYLAVGHVERFNPVVVELSKLLKHEKIYAIEARRFSAFDGRISDANVVEDLMIHDIDIVCSLLQSSSIKKVSGFGVIARSNTLDYVQSSIEFDNGVIATIGASRITENKVREITVHTEKSYIVADLLSKALFVSKNTNMVIDEGTDFAYKQDSITQKIFVPMVEPLRAELIAFYNAVVNHVAVAVNGETAVYAISICEKIIKNSIMNMQ